MPTNRINKLRKENGMNQKELGAMIGVGQTTVSAWETGKNEPDYESMHKMAQFFRVSVGYLMGYESSPYTGLTKEEREHFDKENEDEHFKRVEQQNQNLDEYGLEQAEKNNIETALDFDEWRNTDQATYFEFFQLNKLGDYLTREQRQRILDIAKVMFPNAEKGLYTEEIAQSSKD